MMTLLHDGHKQVSRPAGQPASTSVPERPETIAAQLAAVAGGIRLACLIPTGTPLPVIPEGFDTFYCDDGLLVFRDKHDDAYAVLAAWQDGKLGEILGYGVKEKPAPGDEIGCATLRDNDGTEKAAVVVDARTLSDATTALAAQAAESDTVRIEPSANVVEDRRGKMADRKGVRVRRVRDVEDVNRLVHLAAADNHKVLAPSHVIEKDGEIVGYIGLDSVATYQGWFGPKMQVRDSLAAFDQIEQHVRMNGGRAVVLLLPTGSPFVEHMNRLGYDHLAEVQMRIKAL